MKLPAPNRIAVYLAGAASLLGGLAPAVANLDLSSTIGIVAALGSIVAVVRKFLTGWQAHEARTEPITVSRVPTLPVARKPRAPKPAK